GFFSLYGLRALIDGRLHGQQRYDLKEVILDHVSQAACRFVKGSSIPHPKILRKSDLHTGDLVVIPDGLQKRIGKTKIKDVHDRLLPQEVVDAKDRVFGEDRVCDTVEFASGGQVAPERFFNDDTRTVCQSGGS